MGNEMRITVTFKDNEKEQELYEFIKEESEILGVSAYIKQVLYEKMLEKKRKVTPKE
jgi:hypothetical protein